MTRLQQSLRQRLGALHKQQELWAAFAQAWAQKCGGDPAADADALFAACMQEDPLVLLQGIEDVVSDLTTVAGDFSNVMRQVAIGICLVACERRIHGKFAAEHIGTAVAASDEILIDASEQLAAAVIAAAWCENGVSIRFDDETRQAAAVNVIRDVPPQEFDFQGPRECVKAELQAMVKAPLDDVAGLGRHVLLQDVKRHGVVSDDVLVSRLTSYARKNDCRLMFGLNAAAAHPLDEVVLRKEFATHFGVPTFRYGEAARSRLGETDCAAWQRANLQADLMSYLPALFGRLSAPQAPARAGLQDMRFRVALSLAGEQRAYVDKVAVGLADSLGVDAVFYYPNYEAQVARTNADVLLQGIYHRQSDLVVVFLSADYQGKQWCVGVEGRPIRDLIKKGEDQRIMLFRFDDGEVDGVFSTDITIDCGTRSCAEAATLILERLAATPPRP